MAVGQDLVGIDLDRSAEIGEGAVVFVLGSERLPTVEVGCGLIGIELDGIGEISDRQIPTRPAQIGHASIYEGAVQCGIEIDRVCKISDSAITIALTQQTISPPLQILPVACLVRFSAVHLPL